MSLSTGVSSKRAHASRSAIERAEDRAPRAARPTLVGRVLHACGAGPVLWTRHALVRNVSRRARCSDAGAGDRSGLSSRTRSRSTSPARRACSSAAACGRGRAPRLEQTLERFRVAEIPRLGQRPIERRDVLDDVVSGPPSQAGRREIEMRRPQQRDRRHAREVGADARQHEIERGRVRLGGKRQRIEHLTRRSPPSASPRAPRRHTAADAGR